MNSDQILGISRCIHGRESLIVDLRAAKQAKFQPNAIWPLDRATGGDISNMRTIRLLARAVGPNLAKIAWADEDRRIVAKFSGKSCLKARESNACVAIDPETVS